jgi:CheY-like chemotaxis protein
MNATANRPVTILVVEDHEDSRRMMRILLELDGFRVFTAATGNRAIELAGSVKPDAVLMDMNLPDLDGMSVTRQIRKDSGENRTPIIALTAYDMNDSRDRALAAGCNEFMLKPVNFDRLEAMLCRLLAVKLDSTTDSRSKIASRGDMLPVLPAGYAQESSRRGH